MRYMRILCTLLAIAVLGGIILRAQTRINLEKSGGVYHIPCRVNGLELKFVFDTGASDVSLSLSEALFMLKNGHLAEDDFIGKENYQIASGAIEEGYVVNLRRIEIGGKLLTNVRASISKNIEAPLLLGQSALSKLGTFQFDYATNTLILMGNPNAVSDRNNAGFNTKNRPWLNPEIMYGSVTDIDGNNYATVQIGRNLWMAENLRTTHYQNGDPIPQVWTGGSCYNLVDGGWVYYEDDPEYNLPCGKLYNWYVVADPRNVCPVNWSVPSIEEWVALSDYLGGNIMAEVQLKSVGHQHTDECFVDSNRIVISDEARWGLDTGGTNSSGFSCLPCGAEPHILKRIRYSSGWWSSTPQSTKSAWTQSVWWDNELLKNDIHKPYPYNYFFTIRCIKK
jgi:clan AA aspartic protease (TIGR02281 family)